MPRAATFAIFVCVFTFAVQGERVGRCDEKPPTDSVGRAEALLATLPQGDDSDFANYPLLRWIAEARDYHPRAVNDRALIDQVERLIAQADLSPQSRVDYLLMLANWQRAAGMKEKSVATLKVALPYAHEWHNRDGVEETGDTENFGHRIGALLVQWEGDLNTIEAAMELGFQVVTYDPRVDLPNYAGIAAQSGRHDIVDFLVGRENTPVRSAQRLAQAALGYEQAGDIERSLATARRSIDIMDSISNEDEEARRVEWHWCFGLANLLDQAGERELAQQVLQNGEKGFQHSSWPEWLAYAWMQLGEKEEGERRLREYYAAHPDRAPDLSQRISFHVQQGEIEQAEDLFQQIPPHSEAWVRQARFMGNQLRRRTEENADQVARQFYARLAREVAKVKLPEDHQPLGGDDAVVVFTRDALAAGAWDAVEQDLVPTLTPDQRERIHLSRVANSRHLPMEARIERFIQASDPPGRRLQLLLILARQPTDEATLNLLEKRIALETEALPRDMAETLQYQAAYRNSLGHKQRAAELYEQSLAAWKVSKQNYPKRDNRISFIIQAWTQKYEDIAIEAARHVIDSHWQQRNQAPGDLTPSAYRESILLAKELLELAE